MKSLWRIHMTFQIFWGQPIAWGLMWSLQINSRRHTPWSAMEFGSIGFTPCPHLAARRPARWNWGAATKTLLWPRLWILWPIGMFLLNAFCSTTIPGYSVHSWAILTFLIISDDDKIKGTQLWDWQHALHISHPLPKQDVDRYCLNHTTSYNQILQRRPTPPKNKKNILQALPALCQPLQNQGSWLQIGAIRNYPSTRASPMQNQVTCQGLQRHCRLRSRCDSLGMEVQMQCPDSCVTNFSAIFSCYKKRPMIPITFLLNQGKKHTHKQKPVEITIHQEFRVPKLCLHRCPNRFSIISCLSLMELPTHHGQGQKQAVVDP